MKIMEKITEYLSLELFIILILVISIITYIIKTLKEKKANNNITRIDIKNKTIISIIESIAKSHPHDIALVLENNQETKSISYDEYFKEIKNCGESLNFWTGIKTPVLILGRSCHTTLYIYFGAILNGGYTVRLSEYILPDILEKIINDTNVEVLFIDGEEQLIKIYEKEFTKVKLIVYYSDICGETLEKVKSKIPIMSYYNFLSEKNKNLRSTNSINLNDIISINYYFTKEDEINYVKHTHKTLMENLNLIIKTVEITKYDKFLAHLPIEYMISQLLENHLPFLNGGTLYFCNKNNLLDQIKIIKPTILIGFPKLWKIIKRNIEKIKSDKILNYTTDKKIKKILGLDKCKLLVNSYTTLNSNTKEYLASHNLFINDIYFYKQYGILALDFNNINDEIKDEKYINIGKNSNLFKLKKIEEKIFIKNRLTKGWKSLNNIGYVNNNNIYLLKDDHENYKYIENIIQKKLPWSKYILLIEKDNKLFLIIVPKLTKKKSLTKCLEELGIKTIEEIQKSEIINNLILDVLEEIYQESKIDIIIEKYIILDELKIGKGLELCGKIDETYIRKIIMSSVNL